MKNSIIVKDWMKDIAIACSIVLIISFFIKPTVVCGSSMEPSFEDGDYLLTIKHMYQVSELERGDVVVFPVEREDKLYSTTGRTVCAGRQ